MPTSCPHYEVLSWPSSVRRLALYCPHQSRTQRKLKLQGGKFKCDGTIAMVGMYGPSDIEVWQECWRGYDTALVKKIIYRGDVMLLCTHAYIPL